MALKRFLVVLCLLVGGPASIHAEDAGIITDADRAAIETTISDQMDAFRRDDGEAAFGFAAPSIRAKFVSADAFMSMVRSGYEAVYRPQSVRFLSLETVAGGVVQHVLVVGPDAVPYDAYYSMLRVPDGSWRIGGVELIPADAEEI